MATAILSVLWPEEVTVYDVRVCGELKSFGAGDDFDQLANVTQFAAIWERYQAFMQAVRDTTPDGMSLRDRDRWLWGRSFLRGLMELEDDEGASDTTSEEIIP